MNWIEYAIARTAAQLQSQPPLTEVERWTLHACQSRVEVFEIRENMLSMRDRDQTAPRFSPRP